MRNRDLCTSAALKVYFSYNVEETTWGLSEVCFCTGIYAEAHTPPMHLFITYQVWGPITELG